ncbi:MAG: hypothetical protein RR397_01735 [Odoribacter sp.]
MNNLFLMLFSLSILCYGCGSDSEDNTPKKEEEVPVTLYDESKEAIAYIDYSDEATIYLFEGKPVAYLKAKDQVYSFDGTLLGWYSEGVLYDQTYHAVGAKHGIVRGDINTMATYVESIKGLKEVKPIKSIEENDFEHPFLIDSWSKTSLTEFFTVQK